jgi:glycosyltransferase involved in cell wall biosynthesis
MRLSIEEIEKRVHDSYELENSVLKACPNPLVTVRTSTYQHGAYIKKCIEGILMQKTNFAFEFIIGEDFSTDETREIVFEYAKKYPNIIRVFTADYNVGSKANGKRCIKAARGKYMALCEGDDYWVDPLKLQKQVEFLENNPDYNFSVGAYNTINEKGKVETGESFKNKKNTLLIRDYIAKRFSHTSTFVFRNNFELPTWTADIYAGDQANLLLATKDKKIKYHKEIFSVYRLHSGGIDTLYNNYFERNEKYIFLLKKIKFLTNDWKCKLIINLKIHIVLINNYSLNTWFKNIIKVYTGFLNKVVVPLLNTFLNWI